MEKVSQYPTLFWAREAPRSPAVLEELRQAVFRVGDASSADPLNRQLRDDTEMLDSIYKKALLARAAIPEAQLQVAA